MQLKNYYWYFKKVVPEKICDEIVRYAKSIKDKMAVTGDSGDPETLDQIKDLKKKRDSSVVWLNEAWIYREVQPYIHKANKNAGWNFQWDCSEHFQFTKYNKGQYYDWHRDGWGESYNKPDKPTQHKKIRKLSVT